ncbi:MAG: hypothetical protein OXU36_25320 [Candidatus Poribacteria bacterium]|nr:hypothetical protein [Candidatus Poribacteria bacterium]
MSDKSLIAIYVAENPEAAELLGSHTFSLDVIVSNFLEIYLRFSGKTREELVKMYSLDNIGVDFEVPFPEVVGEVPLPSENPLMRVLNTSEKLSKQVL